MHDHYQDTHDTKVSYSVYSRVVKEMKISFVKLGHEECESCIAAMEHEKASGHQRGNSVCTQCIKQNQHLEYRNLARTEYQADGVEAIANELVMSVDLQKVRNPKEISKLYPIIFIYLFC